MEIGAWSESLVKLSFELRHLGLNLLNSCLLTVKAAPPDNTLFQFGPFSVLFALGLWGRIVSHYCIGSLTSSDLTAEGKNGEGSTPDTWPAQNYRLADTPKFLDHNLSQKHSGCRKNTTLQLQHST